MISVVEAPAAVVFSRGDTLVKLFAGESPGVPWTPVTKPTNYTVELEFLFEYVYGSATFTSVVTLEPVPNSDGEITVNIKELIHSEFMSNASFPEPPLPAIGSISAFVTDNIRNYQLRTRELTGTDFSPGSWLDIGSDLKTIFGGITIDRSTELWDPSALTQPQSMFTWMPNNMMVGLDQPHYITVMGGGGIEAKLYSITNTVLQTVSISDPGTATGECATYFIGPKIFTDGNVANGYKVTLEFQNGESKQYYLDHYRDGKMDLVFINGFGAAECVRMKGEVDETLQVQREKSDVIRRRDTPFSVGDVKQYGGSWDDEFMFRTGYISEGEARALKDMLAFNFLFRIRTDVYESLDIISDEVLINSTGQFMKALEFNAVRAVKKKIMPIL